MGCDMCGKDTELYRAIIEGTEMDVCQGCSVYGKVIRKPIPIQKNRSYKKIEVPKEKEIVQVIDDDYPNLIRKGREKLNLTQKDFAIKLNEKEAIIHKIETGTFRLSIPLAQKFERFLRIKLVKNEEVSEEKLEKTKSGAFTLGDFIKIKKK
ncbi:multiprotein bridging factor aMBF1 [Nanoarchaeota archaeon]